MASSSPFLDRVSAAVRVRHYSIRTEQAYLYWIKRFIRAPRGAVVLAGGSPAREAVTRRIRYRVLGCRPVTAQLSVDREAVGRKPSG